jgi:hypothetical protein
MIPATGEQTATSSLTLAWLTVAGSYEPLISRNFLARLADLDGHKLCKWLSPLLVAIVRGAVSTLTCSFSALVSGQTSHARPSFAVEAASTGTRPAFTLHFARLCPRSPRFLHMQHYDDASRAKFPSQKLAKRGTEPAERTP